MSAIALPSPAFPSPALPSSDRPLPSILPRSFPSRRNVPALLQTAAVLEYREMEHAFRRTGGIVSVDEIVMLLGRHTDQPISQLARSIVGHEVLSFQWRSRTVLPAFQFDPATMAPRADVSAVTRELAPTLDDWETCLWFARPNALLGDARPLDAIALDAHAVREAARCARYMLRG